MEENDAKVLVFSRALREKKEPRVKSLSLIKMGNNTPTPITFDDDEERRCCETHAQQRDDNKEKETYRSYDERSVILRGNKHNLCVCVFVGMLFSSTKISTSSLHLWLR